MRDAQALEDVLRDRAIALRSRGKSGSRQGAFVVSNAIRDPQTVPDHRGAAQHVNLLRLVDCGTTAPREGARTGRSLRTRRSRFERGKVKPTENPWHDLRRSTSGESPQRNGPQRSVTAEGGVMPVVPQDAIGVRPFEANPSGETFRRRERIMRGVLTGLTGLLSSRLLDVSTGVREPRPRWTGQARPLHAARSRPPRHARRHSTHSSAVRLTAVARATHNGSAAQGERHGICHALISTWVVVECWPQPPVW